MRRQLISMISIGFLTAVLVLVQSPNACSAEKLMVLTPPVTTEKQTMWDTEELYKVPKVFPCPAILKDQETAQVKGIEFEGLPLNGKPTKVFAWYGVPEGATKEKPVPGMVLVHGGGGTAFKSWVETWMKRGYAAIAMCTSANYPVKDETVKKKRKPWMKNPDGGPGGWGGFGTTDKPIKDQWTYHAVAAVLKAHSFLASLPGVDKNKIGLTGISWGGYLTCIVSGVDDRFKFAAPVYGCGFYGENSRWRVPLLKKGEQGVKWIKLWDAGNYSPFCKLPMLFCTGTNDRFFFMPACLKTVKTAKGPWTLSFKVRMPHGHPPAGDPPEITTFANNILKGETPLARIVKQGRDKRKVWVEYQSEIPIVKAELCFTKNFACDWPKKEWLTIPATIDTKNKRVEATLPEAINVYYINLTDKNGMIVSTEYQELEAPLGSIID